MTLFKSVSSIKTIGSLLFFIPFVLFAQTQPIAPPKGTTKPPTIIEKVVKVEKKEIGYRIVDLIIKKTTPQKAGFTILGRNLKAEKPKYSRIELYGDKQLENGGIARNSKIAECKITKWTSSLIQAEVPSTTPGGLYRVQITIGNDVISTPTKLNVAGIASYSVSNSGIKNVNRLTNTNSSSNLFIRGFGFGSSNASNFVKIGNTRITGGGIVKWTDTLIVVMLPLSIKKGTGHDVVVRNNLGTQFSSLLNKKNRFFYPGIQSVYTNIDKDGKIKGRVMGLGLMSFDGKSERQGAFFLNDIQLTQIVSWSSKEINFKANFLKAGRYLPKVVVQNLDPLKGKMTTINLYANDSIYVTSKINFKKQKIFGSYYALSLRESKFVNQKINNYSYFVYTLPEDAPVSLSFYDSKGLVKIGTVITDNEIHKKGRYEIIFSRNDLSTGRYLLILEVDKAVKVTFPFINE